MVGPIRVKNGRLSMTCFALILVSLDNGVVVYADRILLSWSIVGSRREANFEERSDRTSRLMKFSKPTQQQGLWISGLILR